MLNCRFICPLAAFPSAPHSWECAAFPTGISGPRFYSVTEKQELWFITHEISLKVELVS